MLEMSNIPPNRKLSQGSQALGKPKQPQKWATPKSRACEHLCALVPTNVPDPATAQSKLHPRKDVFLLKVAKVGPRGDRRCKMELELVTPKYPDRRQPYRVDTREAQCDAPCDCCRPGPCVSSRNTNKWK